MRESGGSFTIKSQDDGTPISELLTLNDGLLLLTQKAIYEVKLADQIDPKRENPNIPPTVQRRILDIGTDSELVGRVLLTARKLFRKEFLPRSIDLTQAMTLAYEALMDIVAMQSTSDDYMLAEKRAIEVAEQSGASTIPCIGNVQARCKSFFQQADHVVQSMRDIMKLFYPELGSKWNFGSLHGFLKDKYGEHDDFTKFIDLALPFLKMVRNTRDCLDHRNVKGAVITDFVPLSDGTLDPPAITVKFRDTNQPSVALSLCMPKATESMLNCIEPLMAFVCSKRVISFAGCAVQVAALPAERRSNKYVQYGYWVDIGSGFSPIG